VAAGGEGLVVNSLIAPGAGAAKIVDSATGNSPTACAIRYEPTHHSFQPIGVQVQPPQNGAGLLAHEIEEAAIWRKIEGQPLSVKDRRGRSAANGNPHHRGFRTGVYEASILRKNGMDANGAGLRNVPVSTRSARGNIDISRKRIVKYDGLFVPRPLPHGGPDLSASDFQRA